MPLPFVPLEGSKSGNISDKRLRDALQHHHFKCDSIRKFIYFAFTFSSSLRNYDLFSKVTSDQVRILDFIILQLIFGTTYMCMDFFIKMYTRRVDLHTYMLPLFKGIGLGILTQTLLYTVMNAFDLHILLRYLITSFRKTPSWSVCRHAHEDICVSTAEVILRCKQSNFTNYNITASHHYFSQIYYHTTFTSTLFMCGLIWILTFFIATLAEVTIAKLIKLYIYLRILTTVVITLVILIRKEYYLTKSLTQIFNINSPSTMNKSIFRICYIYGIGTIGVYDLGTIPQYTMIDNCIIIFGLIYTFCAIVRSVIVRIIFSELSECLDGEEDVDIDSHYLIFAVLPMGTEFLDARKLFVIYLYSNLSVTSLANLAMMTLTISKALLNECHTTNITYMIGMICVAGFALTLGLLMFHSFDKRGIDELITGLDNTVLLLGMGKVALIMWVYGLNKFCTDINFWLGFSPTKYWTSCWATMPLLALFIYLYSAPGLQKALHMHYVTAIWYILIAIIIAVTSIRTFIVYMLRNNLTGVITTNPKYGPPEQEDRHLRKIFNETIRLRQCQHDCFLLDEIIDCNHMPIYKKSHTASTDSLHSMTSLYQAKPSAKQESKHMLHLHT